MSELDSLSDSGSGSGRPEPTPSSKSKTASSRISAGCFVLFGLPFVIAGLFVGSLAVRSFLHPGSVPVHSSSGDLSPAGQTIFLAVFSFAFTAAGIGVMSIGFFSRRKTKAIDGRRGENPDRPWMWKPEWSTGAIRPDSGGQAFGLAIFALLWNGVSFPAAFFAFPPEWKAGNKASIFILLFPLIGIFVGWAAVQMLLRWSRFRHVVLRMELPGVLGGRIRGQIDTGTPLPTGAGVDLTLSCAHKRWTGTGKQRRVETTYLFREPQNVPPDRLAPGLLGSIVPIDFRVPFRLPESSIEQDEEWDEWRLDAKASIAGPDFAASFEIPVFRTSESVADPNEPDPGELRPLAKSELRRPTPESGVLIGMTPLGETEIVFRGNRVHSGAAGWLSCGVIVVGLIGGGVAVQRFGGPIGLAISLGALGLFGFVLLVDMIFGQRRVRFGPDGITIQGLFLRLGSKVLRKENLDGVAVRMSKSAQGTATPMTYEVFAKGRDGTSTPPITTIAGDFRELAEAEWVAEEIRRAVGLGSGE